MACSVPIYFLLHRLMPDGTESFLMEPDVPAALADALRAETEGAWRAIRITQGRHTVLDEQELRDAIARFPVQS
jgi:hypothetical protein